MSIRQRVSDRGSTRKYWTQVPNLVDDSDLDPYGRTLLMHYLRIAGQRDICDETVRDTAVHCRMSTGMVMKARANLEEGGWISVDEIGTHGRGSWQRIHILDRWVENMNRYEKADEAPASPGIVHQVNNSAPEGGACSPGEQNVDVVNNSEGNVHQVNNLYHHVNNSISSSFITGEERKKEDEKPGEKPRERARDGDFETDEETTNADADAFWRQVCDRLRATVPLAQFRTYLETATALKYDEAAKLLVVAVPNPYALPSLQGTLAEAIDVALVGAAGGPVRVEWRSPSDTTTPLTPEEIAAYEQQRQARARSPAKEPVAARGEAELKEPR